MTATWSRRNAMSTEAQFWGGRRGSSSSSCLRRGRERGRSSDLGGAGGGAGRAPPIVIGAEQPGQRVALPANSARTRNVFAHWLQVTSRVLIAASCENPDRKETERPAGRPAARAEQILLSASGIGGHATPERYFRIARRADPATPA